MTRLMSRRLRAVLLVVGTAIGPWWQGVAAADDGGSGRPFDVRVEDGRLSVEVGAVPLTDVLRAIAERAGVDLMVRGELGDVRPQKFTGAPLADGIRRLVEPHGLAMTFEPARGPDGAPRLTSLTVDASVAPSDEAMAGSAGRVGPPTGAERPPTLREFARGGDDAVVAALGQALMRDPDALAQGATGAAIGGFEGPEDDSALRAALATDDPLARMEALRTIGAGGNADAAVGPLVEALIGDEDPEVRRTAVEALADLGSDEALLALEGALDDPDGTVRAAARALGHRGRPP